VAIWLALLALFGSPASASAQVQGDTALAETLFREAKNLMAERRFGEACPKLEASLRLDPAGGTLMNLALCHEGEGKTATAWSEFADALTLARREGRPEREHAAREHMAALEPTLVRLAVRLAPGADSPRLEVKRDGTVLPRPAWGTAVPVDPGAHTIIASAPGRKPWMQTVDASAKGQTITVTVPVLAAEPATSTDAADRATAGEDAPGDAGRATRRTLGLVVGGVGIVGLGIGTVFGLQAFANHRDGVAKCGGNNAECPPGADGHEAVELNEAARKDAIAANVAFGAGIVCLGVGAVLVLTSLGSSKPPAKSGAKVTTMGGSGAALGLTW
jgi:hypothetical protein